MVAYAQVKLRPGITRQDTRINMNRKIKEEIIREVEEIIFFSAKSKDTTSTINSKRKEESIWLSLTNNKTKIRIGIVYKDTKVVER